MTKSIHNNIPFPFQGAFKAKWRFQTTTATKRVYDTCSWHEIHYKSHRLRSNTSLLSLDIFHFDLSVNQEGNRKVSVWIVCCCLNGECPVTYGQLRYCRSISYTQFLVKHYLCWNIKLYFQHQFHIWPFCKRQYQDMFYYWSKHVKLTVKINESLCFINLNSSTIQKCFCR